MSLIAAPPALRDALIHIFSYCDTGLWLVGETALAGYYADHRKSDDLDLFAIDDVSHRMALLSLPELVKKGAIFSNERRTPHYYHSDVTFMNHQFTIDIAIDERLHQTGSAHRVNHNIRVADLDTLFAMKAACLISRCSEKDLFDLDWLFRQKGEIDIADIITAGRQIDGGLTPETLIISLQGAAIRKEACHFSLPASPMTAAEIYRIISGLRERLIQKTRAYEKKQSLPPDEESIRQTLTDFKRFKKR